MSDLFQTSAESITLALKGARDAFDHAGVKGDAAEESVRSFLRSRLPASVGMTRGQVVDSHGAMSRQVDVILYDAMRTPMLFESPEQGHHLVPVEGVLAAIEVKAHLTKPLLESIVENCRSVKSLQKQAYLGPPQRKYNIYEQEWDDFPIYYTVFVFEADNLYAEPLNDLMRDLELHVRVDSVCCLDRGVNLNSSFTGQITNPMGFSPTPTRFGGLCDISTPNALLLWFVTLSTMVFQADCRPIDLMQYARDELTITATLPAGKTGLAMLEFMVEAIATEYGIDPEILRKTLRGERLSPDEVAAFTQAGLHFAPYEDPA